jgi:hypothetical protein
MALDGSQLASLFLCRIYNRGFGVEKSQPMTWAWIWWARVHCSRDVYPDTVQKVGEAYSFYRTCIDSKDRKAGEQLLKKRLAGQNQAASVRLTGRSAGHRSRFPRPDRSNLKPNFSKTPENDVLDLGWHEGVLKDGRPYRSEYWCQDQISMLTYYFFHAWPGGHVGRRSGRAPGSGESGQV